MNSASCHKPAPECCSLWFDRFTNLMNAAGTFLTGLAAIIGAVLTVWQQF